MLSLSYSKISPKSPAAASSQKASCEGTQAKGTAPEGVKPGSGTQGGSWEKGPLPSVVRPGKPQPLSLRGSRGYDLEFPLGQPEPFPWSADTTP